MGNPKGRQKLLKGLVKKTQEAVAATKEAQELAKILAGDAVSEGGAPDEVETVSEIPKHKRTVPEPISFSKALIHQGASRPEVGIANFFLDLNDGHEPVLSLGSNVDFGPDFFIADDVFVERIEHIQRRNELNVDGIVGPRTWRALVKPGMPMPPLKYRVLSAICHVEIGHRQAGFGAVIGEIGDGAGNNFGPMQINDKGSLRSVMRLAGQDELYSRYMKARNGPEERDFRAAVASFLGSPDGIAAQLEYFEDKYYDTEKADLLFTYLREDPEPFLYEKAMHLVSDIKVQGGSFFGSYRNCDIEELLKYGKENAEGIIKSASIRGVANPIELGDHNYSHSDWNRYLTQNVLREVVRKLNSSVLRTTIGLGWVALIRSFCSLPRYADRVAKRKLAIVTGDGVIHGEELNFEKDFGIGVQ